MKKGGGSEAPDYQLVHQILCITSIDFTRRTLYGFVELHIKPLSPHLSKVKLNCKQCRVYRVCVKGSGLESWLEAGFQLGDNESVCLDGRKRSLDYFSATWQNLVSASEIENGGGELTVKLPGEISQLVQDGKLIRISIEFVLDHPRGAVQFVVPPDDDESSVRRLHMFTYKYGNSSRLWFPCIDSYRHLCTWKIEVTVDKDLLAVCPGEVTEKVFTPDEKRVTFHYTLSTPTTACNIALAVGAFEIHVDPELPEITHFCLPDLLPLLKHSTSFLGEVVDFYEDVLNNQYPYRSYKQVFVDEAFEETQSFASMSIYSTNLLHTPRIIEQPFETRKFMALALAEQFFGCFVGHSTWSDAWLLFGISKYLCYLFLKKMFGNNEYKYLIYKELESLWTFELEGPGLSALYPLSLSTDQPVGKGNPKASQASQRAEQARMLQQLPLMLSPREREMIKVKSGLVMRMVELRIGPELLLQAFNKMLSMAAAASLGKSDQWSNMLASTRGFLMTISTVSGKDINNFMDQWLCHCGIAKFHGSFNFNRKRNLVELDIRQDAGKGCFRYVGPLTVSVQELDGSFAHTVQIEDVISHHELPCHSKSRRNKKKKIPLITGEEVDMDLSSTLDSDSPVLWLRIDPDMTWTRHVTLEQPDYMWQYQLRYERDVPSQLEAVKALGTFPGGSTRTVLIDVINQQECFHRVRTSAAHCLAKVGTVDAGLWEGDTALIGLFEKLYGSNTCPHIPRFNDFSNFVHYFLQMALIKAISTYRDQYSQCPRKIFKFVLDLLKYNDNRHNKFADGYYKSCVIEALANTVTPAVTMMTTDRDGRAAVPVQEDAQLTLREVTKCLNLEKLLPSYKYSITVSCLKVIRSLQVNGHIPADSAIFRTYAEYGGFESVRLAALDCLVDFVKVESSEKDLEWLLDMVERDPVPLAKYHIIMRLIEKPLFTRKADSPLNTAHLVERLWQLMNSDSSYDFRLRLALVDLYNQLWGRVTPNCIPAQGFGVVIDLREKKAISNMSPQTRPLSPDLGGSVSASEDTGPSFRRGQKRKTPSRVSSPQPDYLDSVPGTPMSIESSLSTGSKIKLKIKIGNEEASGQESGSEVQAPSLAHGEGGDVAMFDPNSAFSEDQFGKKLKKKKKKKHKHKDRREKEKDDTMDSFSMQENSSTSLALNPALKASPFY